MINNRFVGSILVAALAFLAVAAAKPQFFQEEQEAIQPTAQHKMLLKSAGEWEGELTFFIPGMDAVSMPTRETVHAVGLFWTQSTFHCDMMNGPFDGVGCTGYDIEKKKFVGTWIDSNTTSITLMEGSFDEKTKTLTMTYEGPDMMTGKIVPQRIETVYSDNSYTSNFISGAGQGTKTMVIKMKRKADTKSGD